MHATSGAISAILKHQFEALKRRGGEGHYSSSGQQEAYRRAVYEVVDIAEGHGEGREGEHHALLHIALLEAVACLAHAVASALQLPCRLPTAYSGGDHAAAS